MSDKSVRRFGLVIGIRNECIEEYRSIHDGPGVRDLLTSFSIQNFSIFLQHFPDGKFYEFAYYEYFGEDYEADMEALNAHQRNKEWLAICDAMQLPLPGQKGWTEMEQIYFNP